ncbi:MAG: hypothetical protein M1553_12795 [Firmicutes bacterium]|nr:hypothetical protein [Bacillota bacterium]MCL4516759.1 hypothetical protein [Bacillota bacterium]
MAMNVGLLLFPFAVAWYTASFGLWTWRQGNVRGAIGIFVVAAATFALPLYLLLIGSKE